MSNDLAANVGQGNFVKTYIWTIFLLGALGTRFVFAQAAQVPQVPQPVERPPQFVMMALDGSYRNQVWQALRDFSTQKKNSGQDARFTFFINPVYLLYADNKSAYQPPGYRLGQDDSGHQIKVKNHGSAIGWGDDPTDISTRIEHMNEAFAEGHEIGSHAVGHFDAAVKECDIDPKTKLCPRDSVGKIVWKWDLRWTAEDWKSEFTQFFSILDHVFELNKISPSAKHPEGLDFREHIKGFRAPLLSTTDGLWQNLKDFGFKYDTSQVNEPSYWPAKSSLGLWNFPLVEIPEPATAKKWITMDYNFCVRDSARILQEDPDVIKLTETDSVTGKVSKNSSDCLTVIRPEQKAAAKKHMFDLYMSYFKNNYYGNRAPIHIGHHFSKWMSGAYFEAYLDFANEVCHKPEVKCVTYSELMNFMDTSKPEAVVAYKKSQFEKLPVPKSLNAQRSLRLTSAIVEDGEYYKAVVWGSDLENVKNMSLKIAIPGKVFNHWRVRKSEVIAAVGIGQDVKIRSLVYDRFQNEIQTSTQLVEHLGTENELFKSTNLERRWLQGHLPEADQSGTEDQETLGH